MPRLLSKNQLAVLAVSTLAASAVFLFVAISPAFAAPQSTCWECWTDPEEHPTYGTIHWDNQGGFFPVSPPDGRHESWGEDSCTGAHEYLCGVNDEPVANLVEAVAGDDLQGVLDSYYRLGDQAKMNKSRNAIQILSCQDRDLVVAHFQFAPNDFAKLSRAALSTSSALNDAGDGRR